MRSAETLRFAFADLIPIRSNAQRTISLTKGASYAPKAAVSGQEPLI